MARVRVRDWVKDRVRVRVTSHEAIPLDSLEVRMAFNGFTNLRG